MQASGAVTWRVFHTDHSEMRLPSMPWDSISSCRIAGRDFVGFPCCSRRALLPSSVILVEKLIEANPFKNGVDSAIG